MRHISYRAGWLWINRYSGYSSRSRSWAAKVRSAFRSVSSTGHSQARSRCAFPIAQNKGAVVPFTASITGFRHPPPPGNRPDGHPHPVQNQQCG